MRLNHLSVGVPNRNYSIIDSSLNTFSTHVAINGNRKQGQSRTIVGIKNQRGYSNNNKYDVGSNRPINLSCFSETKNNVNMPLA